MRGSLPPPDTAVFSYGVQDVFWDRFKPYLFCRNAKDGLSLLRILYPEIIQFIRIPDDPAVQEFPSLYFLWYFIEGMTGNRCPDDRVIPVIADKLPDHAVLKEDLYAELGMVKQIVVIAVEGLQLFKPSDIVKQSYEKSQQYLQEDSKVFVRGRVSEEDDNASKLICEEVIPFEMTKKELWIQYADKQSYLQDEQNLFRMLAESEGEDQVVIFCKAERAVKRLPKNANIQVEPGILSRLTNYFGEDCVKVIEKPIEMKGWILYNNVWIEIN